MSTRHDERARLVEAINGLTAIERQVLAIRIEHSCSYEEIAAIMNLSPGRVISICERVWEKLRPHLGGLRE